MKMTSRNSMNSIGLTANINEDIQVTANESIWGFTANINDENFQQT